MRSEPITVNGPTMIHDFALTRSHVVFFDLPVVFDMKMVEQGLSILLRSHDPLVAGKAKDAVTYGVSWTAIREPKNLVVMTALMNLPKGMEATRGMP